MLHGAVSAGANITITACGAIKLRLRFASFWWFLVHRNQIGCRGGIRGPAGKSKNPAAPDHSQRPSWCRKFSAPVARFGNGYRT
jgi:hypothetical protein